MNAATAVATTTAPLARVAAGKQMELLRLVSALSGACRADGNVLKDAALVDLLESQAKAILQSRRQKQKQQQAQALAQQAPTISPQRSKLIKKLADAQCESGKGGAAASKRRKLSFETEPLAASPRKSAMPLSKAGGFAFGKDPAADPSAFGAHRASPLSVFRAGVVDARGAPLAPASAFFKAGGGFKSLDEASVDLSASMASTVASTSAGFYDDMYDELGESRYRRSHSPGLDSRGRQTPLSELTQSVDSIDWSPSDDEDEELLEHAKADVPGFDARDAAVDVSPATASSTEAVMQVLYGIMQHDHKYKWLVDPANQARVAKLVAYQQTQTQTQSQTQSASAAEAEDKREADAALRAQVEELVRENARMQREHARLLEASHMSACDAEEQQQRVRELLAALQTAQSEAAAAASVASAAPAAPRSDAEARLAATEAQLAAQQSLRREAESAFAAELRARGEQVAALSSAVASKDSEISSLLQHVEQMSAAFVAKTAAREASGARRLSLSASKGGAAALAAEAADADESMILHLREVNVAREAEVQRLRAVVAAKDRELCNLHMHLSTKKKLVDELTGRFALQLQTAARGERPSLELALDLDMFLFQNAVEKQKAMDELAAALGVMEREVEALEARVEALESENYTLKVTHEDLAGTLESANSELLRVSAENELMESSLKEKQTRIRNLMLYLEEKEDQIMRLKDAAEQQLRPSTLTTL